MLHIVHIEEIERSLLRIPELVDLLERKDSGFFDAVQGWLAEIQDLLMKNRLVAASGIAALRTTLLSARHGIAPVGIVVNGNSKARKVRDAVAADVLCKTQELVSQAIRARSDSVHEAERLMLQIIAVALRKGLLHDPESRSDYSAFLKETWRRIENDVDVGSVAVHIAGLVGAYDALIVLDRALPVLTEGAE